jgi:hypothetical protein
VTGGDLGRDRLGAQGTDNEPPDRRQVTARGEQHVDDLARLINRSLQARPPARHLGVRLVGEPQRNTARLTVRASRTCARRPPYGTAGRWCGRAESADLGRVQESLVAEVVVLADEGLERAQAVGVPRLARLDFDLEVATEVG